MESVGSTVEMIENNSLGSLEFSSLCTGCGACIATCPDNALIPSWPYPSPDPKRCSLCLDCVEICPVGAISPGIDSWPHRADWVA